MGSECIDNLIGPQLMLWKDVSAVSSPGQGIHTFFFHAKIDGQRRTFKGMVDVVTLEDKGLVAVIQLYLNIVGDNVDLEEMAKKIKKTNSDLSLKIGDKDKIIFKYAEEEPCLAVIGIMEQADDNHIDRFDKLTLGLTSAIEKFCPALLSEE